MLKASNLMDGVTGATSLISCCPVWVMPLVLAMSGDSRISAMRTEEVSQSHLLSVLELVLLSLANLCNIH